MGEITIESEPDQLCLLRWQFINRPADTLCPVIDGNQLISLIGRILHQCRISRINLWPVFPPQMIDPLVPRNCEYPCADRSLRRIITFRLAPDRQQDVLCQILSCRLA